MIQNQLLPQLMNEFSRWKKTDSGVCTALQSSSGSNRQYFRVVLENNSFIGCYSPDLRENESFFYLSDFYSNQGVRVPQVAHISADRTLYFQQDLGSVNLFELVSKQGFSEQVVALYEQSLDQLHHMQTQTKGLDFTKCYPRESFDHQSILWDLNYFKYYFLKVSGIDFDEQKLEDEFQHLAIILVGAKKETFMFRDFQARNIQVLNHQAWLIDFQGGRRGPVLYDLASLLYQASAGISTPLRQQLADYYFRKIEISLGYNRSQFNQEFNQMILIRILQTLGAYGFRGLIEGKPYFKASIKPALANLETHLEQRFENLKIPYFMHLLDGLVKIKDKFDQ